MNKLLTIAAAASTLGTAAHAHHPLNGMPMETFVHGVLSGVGHPVLGFDHLFFVVVVGIVALLAKVTKVGPAAYIAAMLGGCLMSSIGVALPLTEVMIAASLMVVGGLLATGRQPGIVTVVALFGAFGLFHGSAFGGSIASQEAGVGGVVMVGYLIGLGAVQYIIAVGSARLMTATYGALDAGAVQLRIIGAAVAGIGTFLVLENAEAYVFAAIGVVS